MFFVWLHNRKPYFRSYSSIDECIQSLVYKCSAQELFKVYKYKNIVKINEAVSRQNVIILTTDSVMLSGRNFNATTMNSSFFFLLVARKCHALALL